jgi:hypothetical protein
VHPEITVTKNGAVLSPWKGLGKKVKKIQMKKLKNEHFQGLF